MAPGRVPASFPRPPAVATERKRLVLWPSRRGKSQPTPSERPPLIPSSVESRPQRPERGPAKPLIDPRDGDAEDDASSPKQKSLLAIAGSLLGRDQPDQAPHRLGGLDRLSGGDPGFRAAGRDGMGRRRLLEIAGTVWNRRRDRPSRCRRRGLDRLAAVVARGGSEFLGAQRLGGSAWIRLVPGGDPPSGRASAEAKERRRARAHAGDELRRRRNPPRFDRRPGRDRRLAGDAVDRIGVGSRRAALN